MTYYEEGRKKGGFWGKFLAVVLGFLFGIIVTIGSIAAVGYYLVARMTIRQGIEFVGNLTGKDVDYTDYITDEYANETVMGLVGELQKLSESLSDKTITLADLNAISPLVEKQVTDLSARLAADFRIPLAVNSAYHGEDGSVLDEEGNVIIDASGNVVKKDENGRADFTGKDGEMLVGLMDLPFGEISTFLVDSLAPVQVGAVLSAPEVGMLTPNSENYDLLMLVCYGDKGNYKTNQAGDIVLDENGNAEMLGGAKATTFGNLLGFGGSGGMEAIIQNMSVAGLMEATGSLDDSDELVRALLYGKEEGRYTYDETEKTVTWLPVSYALQGGEFLRADGVGYAYDAESGAWTSEEGEVIRATAQAATQAAPLSDTSAGEEGGEGAEESAPYAVYDAEGNLLHYLVSTSANAFEARDEEGNVVKNEPLSLAQLMNSLGGSDGNVMDLLGDVEVATLFGLEPSQYESNKVLFALAYGNYGVDFVFEGDKVVMLGDAKPLTLSALTSGEFDAVLDGIDVDSLMTINPGDNVMCALAYGTEGVHYVWTQSGDASSVEMLPVKYSVKEGVLCDENGEPTDGVRGENGVWTLTFDGNTAYGKEEADGVYLYGTADCSGERLRYRKTTFGDLLDSPEALMNDIRLGSLMGLDGESDPTLLALAYGTEGEDFEIVDGEIVLLEGGKAPVTVGDLTNDETAADILNGLQLGSLLGISPLDNYDEDPDNDPDPAMLSLAYGDEGTHYIVVEGADGAHIEWLTDPETGEQYGPRTIADLKEGGFIDELQLGSLLGISPLDNCDEDPDNDPDPTMLAIAFGEEGTHYIVTDGRIEWLTNPETGEKYAPRTVADLRDGSFIDELRLSTILEVSPLDPDSDPLMTALAFGNEGQHYEIVTEGDGQRVEWLTDPETGEKYGPRTVADLKQGSEIVDELYLSTVLGIGPDSDEVMLALAYGNEGEDYEIVDGEIVMIGDSRPRTIAELKENGVIDGVRLSAVISADSDDAISMYLLYGVEGVHYAVGTEGEIEMLRVGIAVYGGAAYDRGGNLLPGAVEETEGGYLYTDGDTVYRLERQSEESIEIETEEGPLSLPLLIAEDETGEEVFYKPHTIGDLSGENSLISGITKDLTIGQFMGDGEQSSLIAAISAWKIDDLNDQDKIMSLKIADVIGVDENSPAVLQAMRDRDWTLADLNDKDTFNQLALGEVIEIDESNPDTPALLVSLQNTSIGELSDAVNRLTLVELLGEDQVEKSSILRNLADSTVRTLADDISALSIAQVFEDKVYKTDGDGNYLDENGNVLYYNDTDGNWYTSPDFAADTRSERVLTGTWKYLLTGDKAAEEYTLEDIGDLTANMTKNVQSAALNDLYADGVIQTQDGSGDLTFLTEKILYEATVSVGGIRYTVLSIDPAEFSDKQTIGELTIQELIDYVRAVISALNEMA